MYKSNYLLAKYLYLIYDYLFCFLSNITCYRCYLTSDFILLQNIFFGFDPESILSLKMVKIFYFLKN